ncbi:MAG: hypothetical protein NY202_05025 [Mollicutes bacterium UO1]
MHNLPSSGVSYWEHLKNANDELKKILARESEIEYFDTIHVQFKGVSSAFIGENGSFGKIMSPLREYLRKSNKVHITVEEIKKLVLVNGILQVQGESQLGNNKEQLYQEYENAFKKIVSSVANSTREILTNLQNLGYILQEIK